LLQEPQVIFAGYKVPHPLEHNVIIRVQTTNETKPEAMVAKALNDLITEVGYLRTKFMVHKFDSELFNILYRKYFNINY
jgi:DNA-directed RNA polymerase II subunit RPB11